MRGTDHQQSWMFSYISAERRVPADHPLRALRVMADAALAQLGPAFDAIYARSGRPSIAPEKLLRALLLQVLYTVRSERLLMEQLDYNFLFRWFVGLSLDDLVWDATVFTKNRERLLEGAVAEGFFAAVVGQARAHGLLSDELSYAGHVLMENRNGLAVNGCVTQATGRAEPQAAMAMVEAIPGWHRITLGADKGYDSKEFVAELRDHQVTPHVACKATTIIDERTTRHPGYLISQQKRKRIEEIFGWLKTVAGLRKTRHRGAARVGWMFRFALAAYNLVRMRNLLQAAA